MTDRVPVYSFVLPAHNEAANVGPMTARLLAVGTQLGDAFEIVWVNDASTDGTAALLDALADAHPELQVLHLARNFGHMAALTAGLEHARATGAVISLDADGQHPPELIPDLVERWRAGADVVQALRLNDPGESLFKGVTSRTFYRVLRWLSGIDIPEGAADFRLLDRQVVDTINALPERERFLRAIVYWVGYQRSTVAYRAEVRLAGETKYTPWRMILLALNGLTSFSTRPLRIALVLGAAVSLAAMVYAVFIFVCFALGKPLVPGWTSMLLVTLTLGGVQLLALGVASEYLARIYLEQKHRPSLYRAQEAVTHAMDDTEIETTACPCCLAQPCREWHEIYRRCAACGHIWYGAAPDTDALAAHYDAAYFTGDEYLDYAAEAPALRRNFQARVRELLLLRGSGGRLLDLGCAYGYFVKEAAAHFDAEGCDLSLHAVERGRALLSVELQCGRYEALSLGTFDVITLWDAIEHLAEPAVQIAKAAQDLSPGGWLAISTGDVGAWWPRLRGLRWRQFHPPTHLHYFTVASLRALLDRHGFEVVSVRHPVFWRSLRAAAYRILAHGRRGPGPWLYAALAKTTLLDTPFPWQSGDLMCVYARRKKRSR